MNAERPRVRSRPWWEPGVIYQVYPRSFQDSNGDGIGDLRGITQRIDDLAWLGIDAIWLSPIFPSPMADFGYDVADYCDVDPMFGTIADVDALVSAARDRGIRVVLDFVPNHSSDQHPWFIESRSARESRRRDWYVWADPRPDGGPPNNWLSMFGGPAWTWDEPTRQFYLHTFQAAQPELNWRNPEVRAAMYDSLRFWLDRGIGGFRMDVLWMLMKDEALRDNPLNPNWTEAQRSHARLDPVHSSDLPEVQDIVAEMRAVLDEYGDRVMIGEIYLPIERLVAYYGAPPVLAGAHLPFNFQLLLLPWQAGAIGEAIRAYEAVLPAAAWPNWVLGNHDNPRIASRVGPAQARVAAMLLLTLRGTPTIYYGDELGMTDVEVPEESAQDPARFDGPSRDPARTPMRWDGSASAGFTTGHPWLPIGDHPELNVDAERTDPTSMLSLYRRLLTLRRSEEALSVGDWAPLASSDNLLAYVRSVPDRRLVVALNLGDQPIEADLGLSGRWRLVLSTALDRDGDLVDGKVVLRPNEGIVLDPATAE